MTHRHMTSYYVNIMVTNTLHNFRDIGKISVIIDMGVKKQIWPRGGTAPANPNT